MVNNVAMTTTPDQDMENIASLLSPIFLLAEK
jgi:hypothetical protein